MNDEDLLPTGGVDYLPKTPEEVLTFEAPKWVKNAVLLGAMAGAEYAHRHLQMAPDIDTMNESALAGVAFEADLFGRMQSLASAV